MTLDASSLPLDPRLLADLARTPLFMGFREAELKILVTGAVTESHPDGVMLFSRGEAAEGFFLLLDGHVELFVPDKDKVTVLDVAFAPAVLGEAALFVDGHYLHSARVVGHARVLRIPGGPFLAGLAERFDLAQRMLASMSIRLRGLVNQISELKLKSTAQRLAGFLLGLTSVAEGPARVRFPYDKKLAAEALGMTAESLSRALARLVPLGVESRSENLVIITDVAALRDFCLEEGGQ